MMNNQLNSLNEFEVFAVVLDVGTFSTKCGISGDEAPRDVFPTIVGRPKNQAIMVGLEPKDIYVGDDVTQNQDILKTTHPLQQGYIRDWFDYEKILHYGFYSSLKMDPSEQPLLVTEPPLNPLTSREKIMEIAFDTFNVPHFYLSCDAALALFSSGKTTGLTLDVGDGLTQTVPIYEGFPLPHGIYAQGGVTGSDLTSFIAKYLHDKGDILPTNIYSTIIKEIKEKYCYISLNYDVEIKKFEKSDSNVLYKLPDGQQVVLGDVQVKCAEQLFAPGDKDANTKLNILQLLDHSLSASEEFMQKELANFIYITGGTSMLKNFPERLENEIKSSKNNKHQLNLIMPQERRYSVWIGGSILASLYNFQKLWVTKSMYEEEGPNMVHKKCF